MQSYNGKTGCAPYLDKRFLVFGFWIADRPLVWHHAETAEGLVAQVILLIQLFLTRRSKGLAEF